MIKSCPIEQSLAAYYLRLDREEEEIERRQSILDNCGILELVEWVYPNSWREVTNTMLTHSEQGEVLQFFKTLDDVIDKVIQKEDVERAQLKVEARVDTLRAERERERQLKGDRW